MHAGRSALIASLLTIGLALPALAQMPGPAGQGGPAGVEGPGASGQWPMPGRMFGREGGGSAHEAPLITIMLDHKRELGLTPDQERRLRDLRTEFAKVAERQSAEIRVAEIELDALLEQDRWDLAKIEPKVKQIATLQGDLRFARIRTLAAGREVLAPEQLEKLRQVGHRMRPGWGPAGPGTGMPGPGGPRPPWQ